MKLKRIIGNGSTWTYSDKNRFEEEREGKQCDDTDEAEQAVTRAQKYDTA